MKINTIAEEIEKGEDVTKQNVPITLAHVEDSCEIQQQDVNETEEDEPVHTTYPVIESSSNVMPIREGTEAETSTKAVKNPQEENTGKKFVCQQEGCNFTTESINVCYVFYITTT